MRAQVSRRVARDGLRVAHLWCLAGIHLCYGDGRGVGSRQIQRRRVGAGTQHPDSTRVRLGSAVAALLAVATVPAYGDAARGDICDGCALFLGIGYTYHMWGETRGFVIPATLTLDQGRYEVGVFRFTSDQTLYEDLWGRSRVLANPYWAVSASRRWQVAAQPAWRLFFGFGASYKTEEDLLNATHWNFSEQLGVRLHHVLGVGNDMEFAFRHWSNAGLRCPNRGQDFMTVTIAF